MVCIRICCTNINSNQITIYIYIADCDYIQDYAGIVRYRYNTILTSIHKRSLTRSHEPEIFGKTLHNLSQGIARVFVEVNQIVIRFVKKINYQNKCFKGKELPCVDTRFTHSIVVAI